MNRPDGDLAGMSDEDIELACDWSGDEGALIAVLASVGFVDGAEGERCIHDWAEHQPWSAGAEDRSERAKWRAMVKHHGRDGAAARMPEYAKKLDGCTKEASTKDAGSMLVAERSMHEAATRSAPSPSPSPSPSPKAKEEAEAKDLAPKEPAPAPPAVYPIARGTRLPADWEPSPADMAFAASERPDVDVITESAAFRDYWHGKAGADGRKVDWSATWRNWIRRTAVRRYPGAQGARASPESITDRVRRSAEDFGDFNFGGGNAG